MIAPQQCDLEKSAVVSRKPNSAGPTDALPPANLHWQSLAVNLANVQPKLSVSQPGDRNEIEADRFAQQANAGAAHNSRPDRQGANSTRAGAANFEQIFPDRGQALDPPVRDSMESLFGQDFSRVRVHTDQFAASAALALDARAFTAGRDIAFAAGEFRPETSQGQGLLAHELAHVAQQSTANSGAAVLHRAPALSGRKTTEQVDDSIAGDVDKAIAESAVIAKFVKAKSLRKTKGHLSVDDPAVYESHYREYAKKHKDMPDVKDVPGFTDRDTGKIELKLHSADVEAALHEGIHLNSSAMFQNNFGHECNEGVTEYFTEKVLAEQKLKGGRAYRDQLNMATALIALFDENQVGKAYFAGDISLYKKILDALNKAGTFSKWHTLINSDKPADRDQSLELLKQAFGK